MKLKSVTRRVFCVGVAAIGSLTAVGAKAATPVRVGYIPVLGSSALFVIDGLGWAKEAGLELELVRFTSGPQAIQALVSGRIDAYVAGVLPLLQARAHGVDVKVVATGAIEELSLVVRGPLAAGLDAGKPGGLSHDALAARFTDFQKTVGRKPKIAAQPQGSVPDTLLRYWLKEREGVDVSAVDIVGLDIDGAQQALLAGAVDGAVLREPALTVVRARRSDVRTLATGHDLMPDQPGSVLAVLKPDAPERKAWAKALTGLFVRATSLLAEHPEQATPYVTKALGGGLLPPAVIEGALKASAPTFVADPARIMASVSSLQNFEVSQGLLTAPQPVDALFDLQTWRGGAQ
ncbi:nitrate/sulfonate/bicarbonate ABC transporter periplasmic protein [Acetobacter nitrogenifigens DSM 23921 = NBRC 105050]|uniref:Nitrate ABC transporter substrate-binding protein n=1 Tax=Acetobacter nitrogenifigens DSM 23921 = NBRC 105050 TaxID=1120919 RepID=A0A511X9D1_9PROT|nr:ABC transporter substrate-binding protein [Acetobacter nitrogenifigens]GBQ93408.1 nitrate/sulfonate/bicarbonate ABC transporter periplasmic protein [Acetobacter nitrogenifigens DSM 23921 = NBRC 105050]GEN59557.1 hypothetical protein ANI02nite_14410 [Acetobacter nitrogenifigens DSM 23921 = NBRC 105050]